MGEHQFIEGKHTDLCPKFPLVCPNDCEAKHIFRENLQAHKKECPLEKIQCQYFSVGCSASMACKDLQNHNQEKMEEHLSSTMAELVSTKDKLAATEQQLKFTEETLSKTEQRLARNEQQMMLTKQQFDETIAKLQKKIEEVEHHSKQKLDTILKQTADQTQWILHLNTKSSKSSNQSLPVIIRFSDFEIKKDDDEDWYSDPFFTSNGGYKMELNVVPDGNDNGAGTHISVYLYMCQGPNDDKLKWPMRKRLRVRLLNQMKDSYHHSEEHFISAKRSTTNGNRWVWYAHEFISHFDLDCLFTSTEFLVNDTLFFEVSEI